MCSSTETFSEITTEKYYFGKLYWKFQKLNDQLIKSITDERHQNYVNNKKEPRKIKRKR